MHRRSVLARVGALSAVGFSGCFLRTRNNPDYPDLRLLPTELTDTGSQWELTVRVENTNPGFPAHDASLVVFGVDGAQFAEEPAGDIPPSDRIGPVDVSVTTRAFPAIYTITAEESPCDGARIEIYYWDEDTEDIDLEERNAEGIWRHPLRECGEPLPPPRVLNEVDSRSG